MLPRTEEVNLTKGRARLLSTGLGNLVHNNGIVEHKIQEFIETLLKKVSCVGFIKGRAKLPTLILPSIRISSCSYNQTETVACWNNKVSVRTRQRIVATNCLKELEDHVTVRRVSFHSPIVELEISHWGQQNAATTASTSTSHFG